MSELNGQNGLNGPDGRPLSMRQVEEAAIRNAAAYAGGRMHDTARVLGIGRSTLYRRMAAFGMDPEEIKAIRTVAAGHAGDADGAARRRARCTDGRDGPVVEARPKLAPGTFGTPEADLALREMLARSSV